MNNGFVGTGEAVGDADGLLAGVARLRGAEGEDSPPPPSPPPPRQQQQQRRQQQQSRRGQASVAWRCRAGWIHLPPRTASPVPPGQMELRLVLDAGHSMRLPASQARQGHRPVQGPRRGWGVS